ncbi:hypothetical protein D5S18_26940 [Nocardia panacis]|uniref:NADPH-dependent FMN reductase-like domain-containing protein n=1 Tax=Nocardia panacis TaxID=2340916 RepID=A0A3A4KEE9_9NOCA|nr:NAD(P)H-dependent oxidoreductase [Nocardia panacis]RJO70829.1 hypothetical protein D5S18_26940 [Nocardia panacis]
MTYLLALCADRDPISAALATEAQHVAIRNYVDVVIFYGLSSLPLYRPELDTDNARPLIADELRRAVRESSGVLLLAAESETLPVATESLIRWLSHPAPADLFGKPVAIVTAGPGSALNDTLATQLRPTGATIITPTQTIPTPTESENRLHNSITAITTTA